MRQTMDKSEDKLYNWLDGLPQHRKTHNRYILFPNFILFPRFRDRRGDAICGRTRKGSSRDGWRLRRPSQVPTLLSWNSYIYMNIHTYRTVSRWVCTRSYGGDWLELKSYMCPRGIRPFNSQLKYRCNGRLKNLSLPHPRSHRMTPGLTRCDTLFQMTFPPSRWRPSSPITSVTKSLACTTTCGTLQKRLITIVRNIDSLVTGIGHRRLKGTLILHLRVLKYF